MAGKSKKISRKTSKILTTTDEEISKINEENKYLMEDFLKYLQTVDKSPKTIQVYRNNLEIFFVYLMKNARNKDFCEIKKRDILNFQNEMVQGGLSTARIKNIKSSLSSLSTFIENILDEEDKWENFRNIINKIPNPQPNPVREKTILTDEQCQLVLDTLVEKKQYQKACVFALALASGRRKSELLLIKKSWIDDEYLKFGALYKTPEKIRTKGSGTQGKLLYVYILKSKFKKYFDLWMEERERLGVPDDLEDLFITRGFKGDEEWHSITVSTLNDWAGQISAILGVPFYFHCLRHQFTTSLVKAKIPNNVIQDIIGWSSADMINIYNDADIDEDLGSYFSEDGIIEQENGTIKNL